MTTVRMALVGIAVFGTTVGCAGAADEPNLTSACQVESKPSQAVPEESPRGGLSISIGGFSIGGGGSPSPSPGRPSSASADPATRKSSLGAGGGCGDSPCPRERGSSGGSAPSSHVGVGISIDLLELFRSLKRPEVPDTLSTEGPRFAPAFSLGCVPVHGFVRGGWPLVIDYQAEAGTMPSVEVHVDGRDPVVLELQRGGERRLMKLELPKSLGEKPVPALFLVRTVRDQPGTPALGRMNLFGLGAGPRAVGSVAIDQVDFKPGELRIAKKGTARYSFYARSDFNHVAAEILRVEQREGELQVRLARSIAFPGGVAAGTWTGRQQPLTWDGTDNASVPSYGPHLMQVRAWLTAQEGGDWVSAWSAGTVDVKQ